MSDNFSLKSINELLGEHFFIPYYQRGYRWTAQQVKDLLNDIWAFAKKPNSKEREFYCLQPIVVKELKSDERGSSWEVVDGQQRLTTIYIIISYLAKEFLKVESLLDEYGKELYTLMYETRPQSEIFLKNIKDDMSNIDFYHIAAAYNTVKQWFTCGANVKDRSDRDKFLRTILGKSSDENSVQIIWYSVDHQVNSIELFTRLNIGKIPLTNAELIKALFLSSSSFEHEMPDDVRKMQIEISLLWDEMEQRLGDDFFWAFITNSSQSAYYTKIDLLFDMISDKQRDQIDPYYTFLYFLNRSKVHAHSLWSLWIAIEKYYQTLCEWYKNKNLYHKIGYLIAIGNNLKSLIELSLNSRKDTFENQLNYLIKGSVKIRIEDLSYDNNSDYKQIEKVLLLFNIESIRSNESISEYYPFKYHKSTNWSIEHIHAQNSEELDETKKEPWLKWLSYHMSLMRELIQEIKDVERIQVFIDLIDEAMIMNMERITWHKFKDLSSRIIQEFTEVSDGHTDDIHGIANLALLSQPDNAALNNSVFEVKRREIIRMDKEGKYIPLCTRRVFLKYYNNTPSTEHYYFWSKEDRDNYLIEIRKVLIDYLPQQ